MERLTRLPKITQYARAGGLDQSHALNHLIEVVCPPALFVFLLRVIGFTFLMLH